MKAQPGLSLRIMSYAVLKEKPSQGQNFSYRRRRPGNQAISARRRWGKSPVSYDGVSGVSKFKNGAVTAAMAYAISSYAEARAEKLADQRYMEEAFAQAEAEGVFSVGPHTVLTRVYVMRITTRRRMLFYYMENTMLKQLASLASMRLQALEQVRH